MKLFIRELEVRPHVNAGWFMRTLVAGAAAVGLGTLVGCHEDDPTVTTLAVGEETGGLPDPDPTPITTMALGEE